MTRWFIKAALIYLVAALVAGVARPAEGVLGWLPAAGVLLPVYLHLFMVGWVTQLIIGVSLWMFPRLSKDQPAGSERLTLLTFVALNLGLILRAVAEPAHALRATAVTASLLVLAAALQWVGGLAYVVNIWPRVRER